MSALANAKGQGKIADAVLAAARPLFAAAIWAWFEENKDRVLFTKWGFIRITVSGFRPLIEEIAGPPPTA